MELDKINDELANAAIQTQQNALDGKFDEEFEEYFKDMDTMVYPEKWNLEDVRAWVDDSVLPDGRLTREAQRESIRLLGALRQDAMNTMILYIVESAKYVTDKKREKLNAALEMLNIVDIVEDTIRYRGGGLRYKDYEEKGWSSKIEEEATFSGEGGTERKTDQG